ncbi:autotransporter assembly complex protein TamA [Polymorphobacter multimanifer]|uniref:autotransporter assembly complex protein TamA n=1 Tax=Polymorphobacter multimanifer TaxID=1070431 RepID=UPI0016642E2D|nr:BamA/TamA family outer membrane protein [Polymorphobacter multimanifer]
MSQVWPAAAACLLLAGALPATCAQAQPAMQPPAVQPAVPPEVPPEVAPEVSAATGADEDAALAADLPPPAVETDEPGADEFTPLPDADGVPLDWPDLVGAADDTSGGEVEEVRYEVSITGLDGLGLDNQFRGLSALWTRRGDAANLAQIRRRIAEDRTLIDLLLRSVGHFGGTADVEIIAPEGEAARTQVRIVVDPGPLYRFERVDISQDAAGAPDDLGQRLIGIKPGDPVAAAPVTVLEETLATRLADAGYPFPQVRPPEIIIDHATRLATLTQSIDAGPRGMFARTRIEGDVQGFTDKHMRVLSRFEPGQPYDGAQREDLRQALVQTGLFGAVSVRPVLAGPILPDGTQPVDVVATVEAAPPRSVTAAGGYNTGQGIRVEGGWTHRNLFPPEGAIIARTVLAEREQLLSGEFRRRNFGQRDQTLSVQASVSTEQQFAYRARSAQLAAGLVRDSNLIWQKPMAFSVGAQAIATRQLDRTLSIEGVDPNITFYILALPASVTFDNSDNLLDPTRGFRLTGRVSPELTLRDGQYFNYIKAQVDGTYYQPVGDALVLAGRLHMGSIIGASRGRVAPSRRFYAGGGGSVRGFNFQGVGPIDSEGLPTGGNSLTEASLEARYRFKALGNDLGVVGFVDAGQVYSGTVPSFDSLRIGAGVGIRYYTSFGPVRIDVATPITRRPGDPKVAFYVSIGQAF